MRTAPRTVPQRFVDTLIGGNERLRFFVTALLAFQEDLDHRERERSTPRSRVRAPGSPASVRPTGRTRRWTGVGMDMVRRDIESVRGQGCGPRELRATTYSFAGSPRWRIETADPRF
jgi:hypothetical protein